MRFVQCHDRHFVFFNNWITWAPPKCAFPTTKATDHVLVHASVVCLRYNWIQMIFKRVEIDQIIPIVGVSRSQYFPVGLIPEVFD